MNQDDRGIKNLVSTFFVNLTRNIEKPERVFESNTIEKQNFKRKKWYKEVLIWCDTEVFWFAMYEFYFEYSQSKAREELKKKVRVKLNEVS